MQIDLIYLCFILIATISGLIFIKKSSHFSYKLLVTFLIVTLINETGCFYIKSNHLGSTYLFYNFYYYFRFPIFGSMFLCLFQSRYQRFIVYLFFIVSLIMFVLNVFYFYGLRRLHSNYLLSGGIFVVIFSLVHFYNILKNSKKYNPLTSPFFCTTIGLFFYFLGILPFFGIINLLLKKDIIFVSEYLVLIKSLSIFLYILISIDFYIQWKHSKSEF